MYLRKICQRLISYPARKPIFHTSKKLVCCLHCNEPVNRFLVINATSKRYKNDFHEKGKFHNEMLSFIERDDKNNKNNNSTTTSVVERQLIKITSKIEKFGRISKSEFKGLLNAVESEGCNVEQGVLLLEFCAKLIPAVSRTERINLTLTTWNILKKSGLISLEGYHELLASFTNCRHKINAKEMLSEIRESGLVPNGLTYLNLLRCVCAVGDVEQMTYVVNIMKDAGIPLNLKAFNCIILGYGRAGDFNEVQNVLTLMHSSLVKPTSSTYTALLKISAESGKKELFLSYFSKYRTEISDNQRLKVVKSLAVGKLDKLILEVLQGGVWEHSARTTNIVINTCIELIHNGLIDSAFIVFNCLIDKIQFASEANDVSVFGLFFIQEMVRSNIPVKIITMICSKLSDRNPYALSRATETALASDNPVLAVQLLESLKEYGHTLKPHYFWPLLVSAKKRNGESGVLENLETMLKLDVLPDHETMADWVCVHCDLVQPVELVRKLQDRGLSLSVILTPVVQCLLLKSDLQGAVSVCSKFKGNLEWKNLCKPLSMEYLRTEDVKSVTTILKLVKDKSAASDIIEFLLTQRQLPLDGQSLLQLVKAFQQSGCTLNQKLYDAVDKFCKGSNLNRVNNLNDRPYFKHPRLMNADELEAHLIELKSKQMNTRGTLRLLLLQQSRLGNIKRVLEVKKELEDGGLKFSPGMMASLLESYIASGCVREAENCFAEIKMKYPNFNLDVYKHIDLATLYVKSGEYKSAVNMLRNLQGVKPDESFVKNCWKLLNAVCEFCGPDKTNEMLNLLVEKHYCQISNALLGPLIRSHLYNNDLATAVNVYEQNALKYKFTPLQHELLCAVLTKESQEGVNMLNKSINGNKETDNVYAVYLKKIIDIGNKIHGTGNTNVAMFVALAECGLTQRLSEFVKVSDNKLNIPTLTLRCKRLVDENKPGVLENILSVIKDIPSIQIQEFYNLLLKAYVRKGDCDSALSLWTQLQDENIVPSETFLLDLSSLLRSHKRDVPFVMYDSNLNQSNFVNR